MSGIARSSFFQSIVNDSFTILEFLRRIWTSKAKFETSPVPKQTVFHSDNPFLVQARVDFRMGGEEMDTFECGVCAVKVVGRSQWAQHQTSRAHRRKAETAAEFDLHERDMLVDVTTEAYQAVAEAPAAFHGPHSALALGGKDGTWKRCAGAEYIIYDRDALETKCTLCRTQLKDGPTVVAHLKSQKHIHVYFVRPFPCLPCLSGSG